MMSWLEASRKVVNDAIAKGELDAKKLDADWQAFRCYHCGSPAACWCTPRMLPTCKECSEKTAAFEKRVDDIPHNVTREEREEFFEP